MSSSDDPNKALKDWLLKNYPFEAVFIDAITSNVNDILQRQDSSDIKVNEQKFLTFRIMKKPETDYLELTMDVPTMLFMGGMAKAISDVILTELVPNMRPETKKCSKCNTACPKISNYCLVCGSKFES
jgi:hypothetical protein